MGEYAFGVGSKGGRLLKLRDMSRGGVLNTIDISRIGCVLSGCVCFWGICVVVERDRTGFFCSGWTCWWQGFWACWWQGFWVCAAVLDVGGTFFLWAGDGVVPWVGSVVFCLEQVLTFLAVLAVAVQAGGESWWIGFWFGLMVWRKLTRHCAKSLLYDSVYLCVYLRNAQNITCVVYLKCTTAYI